MVTARTSHGRPIIIASVCATVALLVGCSDSATAPTGEALSVCHIAGPVGTLVDIHASELPTHKSHGDYVARLIVDKKNAPTSDSIHFTRISDALAVARAIRTARKETTIASCRITIAVGAGVYQGSVKPSSDPAVERLPFVIDVPAVTLLGTFVMPLDEKGRALGATSAATTASTLVANPGLVSIATGNVADKFAEPLIIVNAHPDGPHGDGAVIEGFVLQSGNDAPDAVVGGNAVWAMRANSVVVRGNQIEGGFAEPIEMRASVGRIERNFLKGRGGSCALCAFGPGDYQIVGNRQIGFAGRLGILVFPTMSAAVFPGVEPLVLPASALVTVAVTNNDLRDHQEVPLGIGLRVAGIGPGAPDVIGTSRVVAQDNDLSNNRFGIVVEAGFPLVNTALSGSIDLTLRGNTLAASCQVAMLIATPSQQTALGRQNGPSSRNSTYTIALGGDVAWSDVWYSHPAGAGNTLTVDGKAIDNGSRVPYDAAKACPVQ